MFFPLVFFSLIRTFDYVESTFVRENSNKIWFSAHLFVLLASPKVLSFENEKKNKFSFCILLTYSYLCSNNFEIIVFLWHKKMYLRKS